MAGTQGCVFCGIVSGELPSHRVYEDDLCVALLDTKPVGRGHTLVVPKRHYENVHDTPEDLVAHIYKVVKMIAGVQKKTLAPAGISVAQNNGAVAGQIIFHFHVHVIPKNQPDHERYSATGDELNMVAEVLRNGIG